ncbi:MAG: archease [Desulfosalsimonadaceae bacterium]
MPYELIDHTADLGVCVTAESLEELFETAAHAMFEQIVDPGSLSGKHSTAIQVCGIDLPDLMINWLRELLFIWNGLESLLKKAHIENIKETELAASIWFDSFDAKRHDILTDIKAVTYHGIHVDKTKEGWRADIIFDV